MNNRIKSIVEMLHCNVSTVLMLLMLCCFQPAFATPTTPTSDFIDNGDGTVTHNKTGLVWMRCSMGQTWDKTTSSCTGTAAKYTWDEAMALKSDFAGHSDWRLPNIAELQTIVERENTNPAINTSIFPNTRTDSWNRNGWFWSSSPDVGNSDYVWDVNFFDGKVYDGYANLYDRYSSLPVRLIRASQSLVISISSPNSDFTDNNDGTVTHKRTGLMWQRCSVGQTWTGSTCSGTATSYTYDTAMALKSNFAGHNDWRVPNANELASIVKYDAVNPAINTTPFPSTPSKGFWSSSHYVYNADYVWGVYFYNGDVDAYTYGYGINSLPVRLVRGQWSAPSFASEINLPGGTIGGDAKGWVNLLSFGNTLGNYMGVTAYMNNADSSGDYQCTDLAARFATDVFHIAKVAKPNGNKFAAANNAKTGYIELDGKRTDIVMHYYKSGSFTPPMNGSIISQTSPVAAGHVSIAKKVVTVDEKTLDVYLFEQNWIWIDINQKTGQIMGSHIADSRKMRFTKNVLGKWSGKTSASNTAIGWLNPEAK